jgi:ubiquinone/menaquinone biosynthesis C-methylase UbiE
VIGLDATDAMLERAKARCVKAGLRNVEFQHGDAENLTFAEASFDGVVTRAAVHHFADPQCAFNEMFRVLRGGGTAVVVDVVSSEDADESRLHNAIEQLRDPSHVRMLAPSELESALARAGFAEIAASTWDAPRELEEWMAIVNDLSRAAPLRTVIRALAESGRTAGIGLSVQGGRVVFVHRWRLVKATKPAQH